MSCAFPQWRIPYEKLASHPLRYRYENRVYKGGVLIQRPEYEAIKKTYPLLAESIAQIPCGKCIQCRLAYSRDWANRCMCELKTSKNAYFLTLTYDTAHLEFSPYVDFEDGDISMRPVLVPKHMQDFMKRLRFWSSEISDLTQRFYGCGEYGDLGRPHYHMIVYDLPDVFLDKSHRFYTDGPTRAPYWQSPALDKLWPFGMSVFGEVNWSTCAYVARYCTKQLKGIDKAKQEKAQAQHFPDQPWVHPFVRMSRRPGLGRAYYDAEKFKIYRTDELFVNIKDQVQAVRPCKYYDRLYDLEFPDDMELIKRRRKDVAEQLSIEMFTRTDLTEEEYLDLKLRSKEDQSRRLIRPKF